LTTVLALLRSLPIYPMFGRGLTRLQPAYVEDVAEAIARALQQTERRAVTFECGGPRIYSYEELLRTVAREAGLMPRLMPLPFAAWQALASISEVLPSPPVTRNQIDLMQIDNVASRDMPGFAELGISPHAVEQILREMLQAYFEKKSPRQWSGPAFFMSSEQFCTDSHCQWALDEEQVALSYTLAWNERRVVHKAPAS